MVGKTYCNSFRNEMLGVCGEKNLVGFNLLIWSVKKANYILATIVLFTHFIFKLVIIFL